MRHRSRKFVAEQAWWISAGVLCGADFSRRFGSRRSYQRTLAGNPSVWMKPMKFSHREKRAGSNLATAGAGRALLPLEGRSGSHPLLLALVALSVSSRPKSARWPNIVRATRTRAGGPALQSSTPFVARLYGLRRSARSDTIGQAAGPRTPRARRPRRRGAAMGGPLRTAPYRARLLGGTGPPFRPVRLQPGGRMGCILAGPRAAGGRAIAAHTGWFANRGRHFASRISFSSTRT